MKAIKNILSILILLSLSFCIGCKSDDNEEPSPSPIQEQLETLMHNGVSWEVNSVIKDGHDVTSQFTGFVLTIGEYTYTTQNSLESAWAGSGKWEFNNDDPNVILRDDGALIDVSMSGSQLTLSFSVSGLSGGRTASVNGDYVFILQ